MVNVTPVDLDFVHQRANHEGDKLGTLVTGGCLCRYRYLDDKVYSSKVWFGAVVAEMDEFVVPSSWMAL